MKTLVFAVALSRWFWVMVAMEDGRGIKGWGTDMKGLNMGMKMDTVADF